MDGDPKLSRGKRRLFALILLLLLYLTAELATFVLFSTKWKGANQIRIAMAGELRPKFRRFVSLPYLLYGPNPGFEIDGVVQHNEHGYRGKIVPVEKTPGVPRILCIGGSTTYGWGAPNGDETYPAHLESILEENLPEGVSDVEVINGGIPHGTSAEILTHYHFKFHYYRPDLVILNTGGNDGEAATRKYYQPDYSHWRQGFKPPDPLPPHARWLMKSRLAALLVILFHYGTDVDEVGSVVQPDDVAPTVSWYPRVGPSDTHYQDVPNVEYGFLHNLRSIIAEARRDGADILLVPFRPSPQSHFPPRFRKAFARNETLLKKASVKPNCSLAPFPAEVISPENWTDACHLNGPGCREKAEHIAPYVRSILWESSE